MLEKARNNINTRRCLICNDRQTAFITKKQEMQSTDFAIMQDASGHLHFLTRKGTACLRWPQPAGSDPQNFHRRFQLLDA
jgi:hypothetical protein